MPLATSLSVDSALYAFESPQALGAIRSNVEHLADIESRTGLAMISLVGEGLRTSPGIGSRIFQSLGKTPCEMISYGGSETTVSFVVDGQHANKIVRRLHDKFFG
jgi:aspartokinase